MYLLERLFANNGKSLILPDLVLRPVELKEDGDKSYRFYSEKFDIPGSKRLNQFPRRALRGGESIIKEKIFNIADACMHPLLKDNEAYLIGQVIKITGGMLPLPGDLVVANHRRSTANDVGFYVGVDVNNKVILLSINDTRSGENGHAFLATLKGDASSISKYEVLASLGSDSQTSLEKLGYLVAQARRIQGDGELKVRC